MINPVPKPNYKRRVPTQKQRNEFSAAVRKEINDEHEGLCKVCGGKSTQIHHVKFRSRGGRGVKTNGLPCCQNCHTEIHQDNSKAEFWQNVFETMYGPNYYKDEHDV